MQSSVMRSRLVTTPFGAAAVAALAREVGRARAGDPLAPVVVVVPTERIGVAARRGLARAGVGGRIGVAGITVVTLRRLAESIGTATLTADGRMPVTRVVLVSALDRLLASAPGLFAQVADHPETPRALAQAHDHLRLLAPPVVARVAGTSAVAADVVRLHGAATALLATTHYDEVDLLTTAAELVRAGRVSLAPVVAFLPGAPDPRQAAFVAALAERTSVTSIVGVSGAAADRGLVERWQALLGTRSEPCEVALPVGDAVIAATDPDDEVRAVVRDLVARLSRGTPGHRIAVLHGSRDPYARLLAEHLTQAGVTHNGRGVRPAGERILGRAVRRLLALPAADFRRDEVMALLADAPVRWAGGRAPATRWERLSREAGVVRGGDWATRLAALAARRRADAAAQRDAPDAGPGAGDGDEQAAQDAAALSGFVAALAARLAKLSAATSWAQAGSVLMGLWVDVLGGDDLDHLPDEERRAADVVVRIIRSLPSLDALGGAVCLDAVRELVEIELDADLDRVGRAGVGVHVGPVSDGVGQELDVVYVVGLAEGLFPPRPADDPLLPDTVRALTDGVLPTLRERIDDQHRQFLAALASAPPGTHAQPRRVLTFPRGDLRRGGVRVPSRWLVPTLALLRGVEDLVATEWEPDAATGAPGLLIDASYTAAVTSAEVPGSDQEWRQRAHAAGAAGLAGSEPDPVAARARRMRAARRGDAWTRFDGLVGAHALLAAQTTGVLSPTSLETWFQCPHRYLVQHVLGVREVEDPEEIVQISAMDRGNVMHRVLDRFVREALEAGTEPRAGAPWDQRDAERLEGIIDAELAAEEGSGRVGLPRLWEVASRGMRADLRQFPGRDSVRRARDGLAPVACEMAFGRPGTPAVDVALGDGTTLRIRGSVDRVDEGPAGLVVIDYKTGRSARYRALAAANPTDHGRFLQLPLYAAAARQLLGRPDADVAVAYWFVTRREQFRQVDYVVDEAVMQGARAVLRVALDGIAAGLFPPRPKEHSGGYGCASCDPDSLGDRTSVERFEALLGADLLAGYAGVIVGGTGLAGSGGGSA